MLSLIARRAMRLRDDPTETPAGSGVPTATKPNLSAVSDVAEEETRGFFEEPNPKGIPCKCRPLYIFTVSI